MMRKLGIPVTKRQVLVQYLMHEVRPSALSRTYKDVANYKSCTMRCEQRLEGLSDRPEHSIVCCVNAKRYSTLPFDGVKFL